MAEGRIARLAELAYGAGALAKAEAIFWDCAATQSFESLEARAAFHALWFGRYAEHAPGEFFLALGGDGSVEGYLAGAPVSDAPPLPGPDYFALFPAELIARFPAHLHVNIRADRRGAGIGALLVRAFADHCRRLRLPGFHAVTAFGSGSAAFFEKCGLADRATARWRGRELVFLGLSLPA
jgi:GNAT superfamily N-acetyltransferase